MKQILSFLLFLLPALAFAQWPAAPNKIRLGNQTTGDGLIYRTDSIPNWTPADRNNAWLAFDTVANLLYFYEGGTWQEYSSGTTLTEGSGITIVGDSINWNGTLTENSLINADSSSVYIYNANYIELSTLDNTAYMYVIRNGNEFYAFGTENAVVSSFGKAQLLAFGGDAIVAGNIFSPLASDTIRGFFLADSTGAGVATGPLSAPTKRYRFSPSSPSPTLNDTTIMAWRGTGSDAEPIGFIDLPSGAGSGVQYSDSLTTFVTPTMLADTAAAIRGDFPTDTNTNLANTDLVNGSVYRTYTIPNTHTLDFIDQGGGNNFLARFSNRGFLTEDKPTLLLQIRDSVSTNFSNLLLTPDNADLFANKLTLKMPPLDATPTRLLTIDPSTREVKYVLKDSIGGSGGPANLAYTGAADVIELDAGGTPVYIAEGSGVDVTQSGDTLRIAATADATGVKVDTVTFFYSGNTIEIFCAYDTLLRNIPIVAVMPGLRQSVSDFEASTLTRFAERGMFAVFINMRGRGNSTGNPDAGANEIKDIWQAVEQVKTTYRRRVDPEKVSIVGYSGGGGNVYSAITKFPYNFSTAISFFGIADYAAWHADGAGNAVLQDTLESWVGGTPASAPDRYEARNSLTAIGNYGGRLIALHDQGDLLVNISQTRNVGTEAAQFPRMEISIDTTISADAIRWHHSLPYDTSDLLFAEDYYFDELLTAQRLQMPESGSMKIQGYLYTPEFRVELGNGANAYGTVEYNTITDTYTITSSNFDLGYCFYLPTKGRDTISATVNDTLRTVVGTPVWTQVYCLDGFSPEDVDSLFYWFAADEAGTVLDSVGGSIADFEGVGEWQDLSGNNHDVAQSTEANRPQYRTNQVNGKPAIYFDGTNDFLISANHLWESDDITVFYVVQYENATRDAQEVVFGKYIANDSSRSWFVSGGNASHGYRHRWVGTNNGTSGTIWEYRSTAAKSASWQQITLRDNNTTREWWVDGVSSANINHNNIKTAIFDSSVAFSIGDAAAAPLLPFQGYIAEIIIYSRALDTTERENVQTYLIEKYGL